MYLQITSKCNMDCMHCCYACNMRGRHMPLDRVKKAITMMKRLSDDESCICLGGGEPTLHPNFFEILKICMKKFNHVWLATNGSQTASMYRLLHIIRGTDSELFGRKRGKEIIRDQNVTVCLSLDKWHSAIDTNIVGLWKEFKNEDGFEIRDVGNKLARQGRAVTYSIGDYNRCVCDSLFFKWNGNIHVCGCNGAPIVGCVDKGFAWHWRKTKKLMEDELDGFNNTCYKSIRKHDRKFFSWLKEKDSLLRIFGYGYGK